MRDINFQMGAGGCGDCGDCVPKKEGTTCSQRGRHILADKATLTTYRSISYQLSLARFNAMPKVQGSSLKAKKSPPVTMAKAKKSLPNMSSLVETVDNDPKLLTLFQNSHLPESREEFSSQLDQCFTTITGRKDLLKDIYSDFVGFVRCAISMLQCWPAGSHWLQGHKEHTSCRCCCLQYTPAEQNPQATVAQAPY